MINFKPSEITACVIDNGLSVSFAERLSRKPGGFGRVMYYCPWMTAFPSPHLAKIGTGYPGVERIHNLFDEIEAIDLFIFLDVHFGDLQEYLRRQGKMVWGSGKAEEMELYRWSMRQMMQLPSVNLPVGEADLITGLPALREFLKAQKKTVYVKVSEYRGIGETFRSDSCDLVKQRLNAMQHDLGPLADEQKFIVEQQIETDMEVGIDSYNIDGEFPKLVTAGVEVKDCGYFGAAMPYKDLPEPIRVVNAKLKPIFKSYRNRGLFSSEIRVGKDKKPYFIDATLRAPSPPGELMQQWYSNWPEIMLRGAQGILIEPIIPKQYGFEFIIYTDFAPKEWQAVQFPDAIASYVRLYNSLKRGNTYWIVPTDGELAQIGGVTGFGDTMKEAIAQAQEHADQITGDRIEVKGDLVSKMLELLREYKAKGVTFGKDAIPESV